MTPKIVPSLAKDKLPIKYSGTLCLAALVAVVVKVKA
jgi:hypothetical protein